MDSGFRLRLGGVCGFASGGESEDSWVLSGERSDVVEDDGFDGSGRDHGIDFDDALQSKSPGEDEG